MGRRTCITLLLGVAALVNISCTKEENTLVYVQQRLAGVTDLRAFSRDGTSIGLQWMPSADTASPDLLQTQIRAKTPEGVLLSVTTVQKLANEIVVGSLDEGKVYTFEVVSVARPNSQDYIDSEPVTIKWAAARRYTADGTAPLDVYEIRSTAGGSGLQFFDRTSGGPKVRQISQTAGYQQFIDVLVDTSIAGDLILESAHRNPLLPANVQGRRTRFSTTIVESNSLNLATTAPPDPSTYIREFITIGPQNINNGRIIYALTNDTNYVRILLQRDSVSGSLLFGTLPDRRIRAQLSYQITPGVSYAKPSHEARLNQAD